MPLQALPAEVLDTILSFCSATDLACVLSTSKTLRDVASKPLLWRQHYKTTYTRGETRTSPDWRIVFAERKRIDKAVMQALAAIVEQGEHRYKRIGQVADRYGLDALDVLWQLEKGDPHQRLTDKFYAARVIHRIVKRHILLTFRRCVSHIGNTEPWHDMEPWQGMTLLAMWMNPRITFADIDAQLNAFANAFTVKGSDQERLEALIQHFWQEWHFKGNDIDYYAAANSLIRHVLDTRLGIPLTLAIVFLSIAQRCGITDLEIMGYPAHIMLRWHTPTHQDVYIDLFSRHDPPLLDYQTCFDLLREHGAIISRGFQPLTTRDILLRLLQNTRLAAMRSQRQLGGDIEDRFMFQDMLNVPNGRPLAPTDPAHVDSTPTRVNNLLALYGANHLMSIIIPDLLDQTLVPLGIFSWIWPEDMAFIHDWLVDANEAEADDDTPVPVPKVPRDMTRQIVEIRALLNKREQDDRDGKESDISQSIKFAIRHPEDMPGELYEPRPRPVYRIGTVFRHKKYDYIGVIYGWDVVCEADIMWQRHMGVDTLTRKANQPFYNVIVNDDTFSKRYVAEENIQPLYGAYQHMLQDVEWWLGPPDSPRNPDPAYLAWITPIHHSIYTPNHPTLPPYPFPFQYPVWGRYFSCYDPHQGIFLPSPQFQQLYPND